jgi:hypothetical protein
MNLGQVIDVEMIKGMVGTYQLDEGRWGRCSHEIMAQRQTLHHALDAGQHHASPTHPGADQHCVDGSRYLAHILERSIKRVSPKLSTYGSATLCRAQREQAMRQSQ